MIFKTTITDINKIAVVIDKISTMTLPNYSGLGIAIEGLTAKQAALVLSTRNLSQAELEEVVVQNDLISKYGAEQLVKSGLLSTNSSLLVSEKAVSAEKLKESITQSALNKEKAEEFIQTQLSIVLDGEESASTIILNKALMDEAVKRGILTKEKAAEILSTYGVVAADSVETGSKKGLIAATLGLIKSKIALSALDSAAVVGISALVFTIYKCNKAVKEARDRAQELGDSFKETSSTIDDYKSKIIELYKAINDESSSIEDTTNARKSLLSVQDELIDKFGTEESVINNVTDAINGQTDALDRLTQSKWQEIKNQFNNGGFWNIVANFFQGTDNIQRMLDEYGERTISFKWVDFADIKLTDEMVAELENIGIDIKVCTDNLQGIRDFDSLNESISQTRGASLSITGNAEEIYNKLLTLQNLVGADDSLNKLYNKIESVANSYKDLTDTYKDFYDQYILYEKILTKDSDYADTFKEITDAYEEYSEAFTSGDEDEIRAATEKYAKTLTKATANAIANGDSDVATYFESMYPVLRSTVEGWKFNVAFDANTNNLQNEVQSVLDELKDENGRSLTAEEILGLGKANEQYQALISIAHAYNMSIEEMVELLKERNLVSAMDYQGLVGLFGQENIDKLSPEDLEIAYQIKNVGNMTFDKLQSEIEKTKENASEPVTLSALFINSTDSLDKFQSSVKSAADAYTTLLSGDYSSSELLDSIQAINQAATDMGGSINWESIGNIEELDKAIQSISNTYLDSFLNSNNINPDSDFARMLRNVADETYRVKAAYDAFNGSVDTIQNSYKTLNDAITEYNQNGHVTLDTLQSILEIDNRYISCLMDENGKLALNEEMYEKLTLAKLDDAKNTIIQEGIQELENIALENSAAASDKAGEAVSNHAQKYKSSIEKIQKHTRAVMDDSAAVAANNEVLNGGTVGDLDAAYQKALAVNEKAAKDSMAAIEAKLAFVDSVASNTASNFNNISNAASSSSASAVSDFSETIDFFERRVEVLDDALSHLDSTLDNVTGSFGKNNLIDAQLSINEEKFNNYSDALSMYTQKASEALSKLPADIAAKVKDGAVVLTDFIGDANRNVVDAIREYESWAGKISDCQQELTQLKTAIRQLELEKFNNIMDDFSSQFSLRDNSKDLISKQIDLLKEAGELIGRSFYTAQIDQTKKQLELLETEKERLVNQMSSAINSGRVQKGTEEWLEMVNALNEVDGSILDCKKSIEEFDNAILDLRTEIFDRIQKQFSNLDSELSNILDLFDGFEVSDDKGAWSKEGLAQLGLLAQQYELAQYRVQQYNDEIDELNAQYLAGKYSATEYGDKLAELSSGQWDAVQASESAKDAIMDLNEARVDNAVKGIEKEIDAYKELIDAQLDALKASKDLHDYEKSIAEKTKSVTDLERQIAAMQNDTSAAAVAKRKTLEDQLAEARKDLEEAEYEHSVEVQEDALNKQYEAYEKSRNEEIDKLRESLTDRETILAESFDTVKNNASTIGQQITTVTKEHGVNASDTLVSSWQSGKNAVAGYGQTPSQNTSAFTGNIMGAETEINNRQKQADALSGLLAGTYSAKADNLAAELITSYNTGSNPPAVTDTLHDSPANTPQGGYAADKTATAAKDPGTLPDKKVSQAKVQHGITDGINTLYSSSNIADINKWLDQNKNIYSLGKVTTSASGAKNFKVSKYASGSRNAKGGLRIVDEEGSELTLAKLSSGNYTIGNAGDQILTKAETDNVFEWAKIDPKSMIHINMMNYLDSLRTSSMPNILPNNVNNNTNNNNPVQIGNLINVQGSINSSDVKQMESIANKAVDRLANKIHDRITYGS